MEQFEHAKLFRQERVTGHMRTVFFRIVPAVSFSADGVAVICLAKQTPRRTVSNVNFKCSSDI